jgi:hypothetical protein
MRITRLIDRLDFIPRRIEGGTDNRKLVNALSRHDDKNEKQNYLAQRLAMTPT